MGLLTYLHLSKFKKGDKVKIINLPKHKGSRVNGFKDLICIIDKIDLKEKFTNGIGSISLKIIDGGYIIGTGIVTKQVRFKLV